MITKQQALAMHHQRLNNQLTNVLEVISRALDKYDGSGVRVFLPGSDKLPDKIQTAVEATCADHSWTAKYGSHDSQLDGFSHWYDIS